MLYTQSRETSAELLRAAIGHMGRHDAALHPISYSVWYEYAAGINPRLNQAVGELTARQPRLDDAAICGLFRTHVAGPDADALERIGQDFQQAMHAVAESASTTGARAGTFGAQLSGLTQALQSSDMALIGSHVAEAMDGTARMQAAIQTLQDQVAASRNEVERLRSELACARDEAFIDTLSGTLNRRGFDHRLRALWQTRPPRPASNCLVMLDIDHFKKVNDTHGHLMGDKVIEKLGEILRNTVSDSTHSVARYGGEEFAMLLPGVPLEQGKQVAEKVRERTGAMKIRNRVTQEVIMTVTISAGVTELRDDDDPQTLVARADSALYQSKQSGRNRVTCV